MSDILQKLISRHYYSDAHDAQSKLDVFFAVGRLTADDYAELTALTAEIYAEGGA